MRFATVEGPVDPGTQADAVLVRDNWNDYGFQTQFDLFARILNKFVRIGRTKIVQLNQTATELPIEFESLGDEFCSLGQSPMFYETLRAQLGPKADGVLLALRDVHFEKDNLSRFQGSAAVERSMLRFSMARSLSTSQYAARYSLPPKIDLQFDCQLTGFSSPHGVHLAFDGGGAIPSRTVVLIGQSGAGKTGILSKLAYGLTGETNRGLTFVHAPPLFRRVLAISYGVMQPFKESSADPESYVYCGPQNLSSSHPSASVQHFSRTIGRLGEEGRSLWKEFWIEFVSLVGAETPIEGWTENAIASVFASASAGHRMYARLALDFLTNIVDGTLVLLDEPELHLHPGLLTTLIAYLDEILAMRSSFAVIATHAPIVVQSVLASQVRILSRRGQQPLVQLPDRETFGSGLSELAESSFRLGARERNFLTILTRSAASTSEAKLRQVFTEPITLPLESAIRRAYAKNKTTNEQDAD